MKVPKILKRKQWKVVRTIWPYPHGYGTYNPSKHTLLDSGLTKERAEELCAELNSK